MNQEIIPDNNLPVYLQKYDVDILDDKKESVGKDLYTTVGAIPSNEKEKRVWQLNLTGYLKPNVDTYNIVYDFSNVDYKYKEQIRFENIVSGTFNICGQVLDASKIIGFNYFYSDIDLKLTIKVDTSKWDFRLKKEVLFSYQLNLDDSSFFSCNCHYNLEFGEVINAVAVVSQEGNYFAFNDTTCYDSVLLNPEVSDSNKYNYVYPNNIKSNDSASIRIWSNKNAQYTKYNFTDNEEKCGFSKCFKVTNISYSNGTFDVRIS